MKAVILCGGKATRLGAVGKSVPKILLPLVSGRTILQHQLDMLHFNGVSEVVLATGHLHDKIVEFVDLYKDSFPIKNVTFSKEDVPLGTGGAIKKAMGTVYEDPYRDRKFIAMNGDTYMPNLNIKHCYNSDWTYIVGAKYQMPYGTITKKENGVITGFEEKKDHWISAGLYVFSMEAIEFFNKLKDNTKYSVEYDVLPNLKSLFTECEDPWFDLGTTERIAECNEYMNGKGTTNVKDN